MGGVAQEGRERERERQSVSVCVCTRAHVSLCVCVCVCLPLPHIHLLSQKALSEGEFASRHFCVFVPVCASRQGYP